MKQEHLPGLAIVVLHHGATAFAKRYYGFANIENRIPTTPDTVFRIRSISKSFTIVILMQQWERGKFQIDDPIMKYLSEGHRSIRSKNPATPPVTIHFSLPVPPALAN